ncbi:hypothetical protein DVH24_018568 [Malus domestica]|uniref:PB1 domain-containing protein n=1 Tax=Malus domestica TaxID=3750 RepID=A0A498HQU2_MALDO|nr:hypothetical protein DVH24_018568 [Malus domestica]
MVGPSLDLTMVTTIKFLCSYGGKIFAVPRSISFSELSSKLTELCGPSVTAVSLRCQLPTEDLDALVSIKSDEDLVNLIEEYGRAASSANMKIRAFLSLIPTARTPKSISSPSTSLASAASTTSSSGNSSSSNNYFSAASGSTPRFPMLSSTPVDRCLRQMPPQPSPSTVPFQRPPSKVPHCANIYHARQGHGSNKPASTTGSRPYLVYKRCNRQHACHERLQVLVHPAVTTIQQGSIHLAFI